MWVKEQVPLKDYSKLPGWGKVLLRRDGMGWDGISWSKPGDFRSRPSHLCLAQIRKKEIWGPARLYYRLTDCSFPSAIEMCPDLWKRPKRAVAKTGKEQRNKKAQEEEKKSRSWCTEWYAPSYCRPASGASPLSLKGKSWTGSQKAPSKLEAGATEEQRSP